MEEFDEKALIRDLKRDAKAIGIPSGAAEIFIKYAVNNVKHSLADKKIITKKDLERLLTKELKKYNADLAYVQTIRDKII